MKQPHAPRSCTNLAGHRSSLHWRLGLALVMVSVLTACGGGGGGAGPLPDSTLPVTATATTAANTVVVDQTQAALIGVTTDVAGNAVATLPAGSPLADTVAAGQTLVILPGQDARYPLGLTGVVSAVGVGASGQKEATLAPATLADVVTSSSINQPAVQLSADNFVGVIAAPTMVSALQPVAAAPTLAAWQTGIVGMKGALVMRTAKPGKLENIMTGLSVLGGSGTVDPGDIAITVSLKLADIVKDPSRFNPYGGGADAKVNVNFKLKNLQLTENHEFKQLLGQNVGLDTLDLRLEGDMEAEAAIVGNANVVLGYYSQAWKEVEDESLKVLGVSGKLTGLDSKDKVGKFPLAGLVFSLPCSATGSCPVVMGKTQTPLRQAKLGGLILWVYITADGQLTLDGTVGARAQHHFAVGMRKPSGGALEKTADFSRVAGKSGNVLEVPFVNGTLDATERLGVSVDLDFFALGVRIANAGLDAVGRYSLKATGVLSYGLPDFGQPWAWSGNSCYSGSPGGGLVFKARIGVGAQVDSALGQVYDSLSYEGQWPTVAEMAQEGWHGITVGPYKTWYTGATDNVCWPQPVVNSVAVSVLGTTATLKVQGSHLPDDLALSVTTPDTCAGLSLVSKTSDTLTYTCTVPGQPTGAQPIGYAVTSGKAGNLDVSALAGQWTPPASASAPTQTAVITAVADNFGTSTGPVGSGGSTDDTTPTLSGTLSAALGATQMLRVYDGSTLLGAAVVIGQSWSYTPPAQAAGSHSYRAVVASADGIEGRASAAYTLTVVSNPTTPPASTGRLTDTGATASQCYQAGSDVLVSCTSAAAIALNDKQDGMIGRDVSSPDNADGKLGFSYSRVGSYSIEECVRDNITGLTWEGKTASGWRAGSNIYTNYDSTTAAQIYTYTGSSSSDVVPTQAQVDAPDNAVGYKNAVNASALCGYTDWRLPTVAELQSLVDYSVSYPGPTIDSNWFPNTSRSNYWSATTFSDYVFCAWGVDFVNGGVSGSSVRGNTYGVRLVR